MTLLPGPGVLTVTGAGLSAQEPVPPPSAVESPLPGGIATLVRFLFSLPSWIQITGLIIGLAVAIVVLVMVWRRRAVIRE